MDPFHFFPFPFFFLPPGCCPPAPDPPTFGTFSTTGVATPLPSPTSAMMTSSFNSGKPAMPRPNFPRICINRETSAALVVLYFNVVPDAGSYVFRVRVARMGSAGVVGGAGVVGAAAASSGVGFGLRSRFEGLDGSGRGLIVYFVVMRV